MDRTQQGIEWRDWLKPAMDEAKCTSAQLVVKVGRGLGAATVARWLSGDMVPDAETAAVVAFVLRADLSAGVRAAGFPVLARLIDGEGVD